MPATMERRRSPRLIQSRPVKLRCDRTGMRYLSGRTHNISTSGALVSLEGTVPVSPGQRVELAVASQPRQALLRRRQMIWATVVRSLRHDGSQYLALRFAQPHRLARAV